MWVAQLLTVSERKIRTDTSRKRTSKKSAYNYSFT